MVLKRIWKTYRDEEYGAAHLAFLLRFELAEGGCFGRANLPAFIFQKRRYLAVLTDLTGGRLVAGMDLHVQVCRLTPAVGILNQ